MKRELEYEAKFELNKFKTEVKIKEMNKKYEFYEIQMKH